MTSLVWSTASELAAMIDLPLKVQVIGEREDGFGHERLTAFSVACVTRPDAPVDTVQQATLTVQDSDAGDRAAVNHDITAVDMPRRIRTEPHVGSGDLCWLSMTANRVDLRKLAITSRQSSGRRHSTTNFRHARCSTTSWTCSLPRITHSLA